MPKLNFSLFSLFSLTCILMGCGGGGSSDNTTTTKNTFSITGSAAGLASTVDLTWASQTKTIDTNGDFTFTAAVTEGDSIRLSLTNVPESQECAITGQTTYNNISTAISGIAISCVNKIAAAIHVSDYYTGEAINPVTVTAIWEQQGEVYNTSAPADELGLASFYFPPVDSRITFSASTVGYSVQSRTIEFHANDETLTASIALQPVNAVINFNASTGGDLAVQQLPIVSVPASAFVTANGETYNGEIRSEITLIDPSSDPALMPGGYQSINSQGETAYIESFGAIDVSFFDATGNELNLASGQTATIRIPVSGAASNAPATLPLYYFDTNTGYWIEEGQATLTTVDEQLVYQGEVSHFTVWNADIAYQTVYIEGCVESTKGSRIADARIQSRGLDYIGTADAISDSFGLFRLPVRIESNALISAISGGQSRTLPLSIGNTDITLDTCLVVNNAASTITLSWGENPSDLDAHFFGPSGNTDDELNSAFHLYFASNDALAGTSYIYLDVDDINSFGPEVVSISDFSVAGTYHYAVYHFAGSSDIAASPARVELNLNGVISVFSPPSGDASTCWAVFDIVVADDLSASVVPVNAWSTFDYCYGYTDTTAISTNETTSTATAVSAIMSKPKLTTGAAPKLSIYDSLKKQKYYTK